MFSFLRNKKTFNNLQESRLFDETSFYKQFISDLHNCKEEVIIESPYITSSRIGILLPTFKELLYKRITIHIITRDPVEHDENTRYQATNTILSCSEMGINIVLLKGNYHRKLAIIDRNILWEGSLNILSFSNSREIMRRIEDGKLANQMITFLKLKRLI